MTVGISITHGKRLEAIVIADTCVSGVILRRESNSVNKIKSFKTENYHGVIFGSGNANPMIEIFNNLDSFFTEINQEKVEELQLNYLEKLESIIPESLKKINELQASYSNDLAKISPDNLENIIKLQDDQINQLNSLPQSQLRSVQDIKAWYHHQLSSIEENNLDYTVKKLQQKLKSYIKDQELQVYSSLSEDVKRKIYHLHPKNELNYLNSKAELFSKKNLELIQEKTLNEADQNYKQNRNQEHDKINNYIDSNKDQTELILVAFDKKQDKIRKFVLKRDFSNEHHLDRYETGSGGDGANMYLSENLQGITANHNLKTSDLTFFAVNAYSTSSMNSGVSGTPTIANVTKEGVLFLPRDQTCALVNLSGAYKSRFNEAQLTHKDTRKFMKRVLNSDKDVYKDISRVLGQNIATIKSLATPYSAWQEAANQKHF